MKLFSESTIKSNEIKLGQNIIQKLNRRLMIIASSAMFLVICVFVY